MDIRDYEQWSRDRTSVCACVHEREFEAWLCVARVINLSGFYKYFNVIEEIMVFNEGQAEQKILGWKAHLLRYVNQDEAWLEVTNAVDESSVLLVQDWAVTFLPRKF